MIQSIPADSHSVVSQTLAQEVLDELRRLKIKIATAESLTGGLLAAELVSVPGASEVFLGGTIAYQNQLKSSLLLVDEKLLQQFGPVDARVALQMARGVRAQMAAAMQLDENQVAAIATTGVAGPLPQGSQPVGKVFIAVCISGVEKVIECDFAGDRDQIRTQTVRQALLLIREAFAGF